MTLLMLPPIEPQDQSGEWDYTIALGDVEYKIVLNWRERSESWYLSLYDADDVAIFLNRRLSADFPIGQRTITPVELDGVLICVDTTADGAGVDPGYEDLGYRCQLFFVPYDDFDPPDLDIYEVEIELVT